MKITVKADKISNEKKWRDFEGTTEGDILDMLLAISEIQYKPNKYNWKQWYSLTGVDPRLLPEYINKTKDGTFYLNQKGIETLQRLEPKKVTIEAKAYGEKEYLVDPKEGTPSDVCPNCHHLTKSKDVCLSCGKLLPKPKTTDYARPRRGTKAYSTKEKSGAIYTIDMATGQVDSNSFRDIVEWLQQYYSAKYGEEDYHTQKYWIENQAKRIIYNASQEIEHQIEYGMSRKVLSLQDEDIILAFYNPKQLSYEQVEKAIFEL